jgi:type I restriction enzyme S subunit
MMGEWQVVTLGKVAEILMGQSPPGSTYNERMEGLPFFQGIADFDYRHPIPRVYCTAPTRIAQPGDILLSVRAPIGKINIANRECAIGRGLSIIRARDPKEARYIEFALRNMENFWNTIEGGGSVFGNATKDDLEGLSIPWPENRSERLAIAHILGTLDDKIELNRRMSQTLEEMARALFKAWFVDFEPVRAKMQGRWRRGESLPGLPAHLYDLFPDRLVDSQLGMIPEGWEVDVMRNHFRVTMGQSPPGNTYNETGDGLPFYQGRVDFGFRFPDRRVFCSAPTRFADVGDTLVTVRAPVGDSNIAIERCCIGRGVASVRHTSGAISYTYYFVRSIKPVFENFEAEGTVFGAITKDAFLSIKCVVPPTDLVQHFEKLANPMDEEIKRAECESRTLAALRDALLPRLVRGEIRVKDAEKFLQERGL